MTRHRGDPVTDPEAVIRFKGDYCELCWNQHELTRPLTPKEQATLDSLMRWKKRRDERVRKLEERGGIKTVYPEIYEVDQKVFPTRDRVIHKGGPGLPRIVKTTDVRDRFKTLVIDYTEDAKGQWWYTIVLHDGAILDKGGPYVVQRGAKRRARRLAEAYEEHGKLLGRSEIRMKPDDLPYQEGTFHFMEDSAGKWRFSIIGKNNKVMAQSEAYASLGNAKRGARALARRLNVKVTEMKKVTND